VRPRLLMDVSQMAISMVATTYVVPVRRDLRSSRDRSGQLKGTAGAIVVAGHSAGSGTLNGVVARPRTLDRSDVVYISIP
jgi:hypothetical protein